MCDISIIYYLLYHERILFSTEYLFVTFCYDYKDFNRWHCIEYLERDILSKFLYKTEKGGLSKVSKLKTKFDQEKTFYLTFILLLILST